MGRRKLLTPEQLEEVKDRYNELIVKENDYLTEYPKAERLHRVFIAKKLKDVALKLTILENTIDSHK
jgi:hypothetical protein